MSACGRSVGLDADGASDVEPAGAASGVGCVVEALARGEVLSVVNNSVAGVGRGTTTTSGPLLLGVSTALG